MNKAVIPVVIILLLASFSFSSVSYQTENVTIGNPISKSDGGPMNSSWPMQSHDIYHTGRSPLSTMNNSGDEAWRFQGEERGEIWSSAVIDKNGTIYFGTLGEGFLYALNENGMKKWRYQTNGVIWSTPGIAEDGTIYVATWGGDYGGYLYAINPNGMMKWVFWHVDSIGCSPTIGSDGTIYFGTMAGYLFAINPNGTEIWRLYLGGSLISSPAIDNNNIIYIGTTSNFLFAVNPNGTLRWQFGAGQFKGNPSIGDDGTIYAPSFDGYLYALCPNGTMKWRASTGNNVSGAGVALASDGTIYIGTELLRAYYPNGTLKWSKDVQGELYGTVPAVSADGTIYVSAGGSLVAVNPDGTVKWRKQLTIAQIHSSPCIGPDDRVYVGSETYELIPILYLHAFGILDTNAPTAPIIKGQTEGKTKRTYSYTFSSTSPLGNNIYYTVDWGDGTSTGWLGPYSPGETLTLSHSWESKGTYLIQARAKDTGNLWGPWGKLQVTMPLSYELPNFRFLDWLLERFPNAFPILHYLLGFN